MCRVNASRIFAHWLGTTPIKKDRGEEYLEYSAKDTTYYKSAKRVLTKMFPTNIFSTDDSKDWHASTKSYFETQCKRSRINNEEEKIERKLSLSTVI